MNKSIIRFSLIYIWIMIGFTLSSQISKKLWGIDYIGEIQNLKFTYDYNALITTKNGILAVLDLNRNEIVSKKNNIFANNIALETTEKFSILFDYNTGTLDILDNEYFKIKNTINLTTQKINKNYKVAIKQLKEKESIIGIFMDSRILKVFNEDKIVRNFESKASDNFLDFFINTNQFEIKILSFDNQEKKIKISNLDLKVKSNKIDYFFDFDIENIHSSNDLKTLISEDTFLVFDGSTNTFVFGKLNENKKNYEVISGLLENLKEFKNCEIKNLQSNRFIFVCDNKVLSKSAFLFEPLDKSEAKIKSLDFGSKDIITNIFFDNKYNTIPLVFLIRKNTEKNNEYLVETFGFDNEKSSFISMGNKSYSLQEDDEIKIIRGNYKTENKNSLSYIIVTKFHQIRIIHIHNEIFQMYIALNQKYLNIVKSELITVKNIEKKKRSKPTLNTLSSLIHQKDVTKVLKNAYNLFLSDTKDVYFNIKNTIENYINPNNIKTEEIIVSKNEKVFLILFSANSELYILDAITGEKKFEKKFPNFTLYNIRSQSNPNIFNYHFKSGQNEIDNPIVNFELKNTSNKNVNDLLLIQINLQDFSYQEIDFNLKSSFSLDDLTSKINKELNQKNFKESIEFELPSKSSNNLEKNDLKGKIILTYNENQNTLYGMKVFCDSTDTNVLKPIWNFKLGNHKLIQYKLANVPENIHTVYNSSGKILYKHIDHNVILLISNIETTQNVSVTLISVINGKILYQTQIANIDLEQKINSIFDENFIIINYVKKTRNVLRNEVFTIELMRREIEHSLVSLFQKLFNFKTLFAAFNTYEEEDEILYENNKKIKSNNDENEEELVHSDDLVFLTKTFFLPRKVKSMFLNKTKLNVANKYIIFLLESNQVFLVDKRVLSPRRPLAKVNPASPNTPPVIDPLMNSPYADLETTPYFPNIVLDPKFIVDVDYSNSQIDNINIQHTKFESTFILCTTGLSVNCYKVFPDKTFDYFVSIFPNVFILIALMVLFVFTFTFRRYVKKIELKQLFLNSP